MRDIEGRGTPVPAREWLKTLSQYAGPDYKRSIIELVITIVPFALLWFLAYQALTVSYWLTLAIAVPAAGLLVRLFLIQHDCGHRSLFSGRAVNDWVGRVLGVITVTPYDVWQHAHAAHHAGSGNLDLRGMGDIDTLTLDEYRALSTWCKAKYRIYRHPLMLFGFGPAYVFLIRHRLPLGMMKKGWQPWVSAMGTNAGIAVLTITLIWMVGLVPFLLVHLPIVVMAATIGVWLFYVQHQFEETIWAESKNWNKHEAALFGSSHYDLPKVLRWFSANIGIHHVHHLYSRIPFYRLPQVLRDYPELANIRRLTLMESFKCVKLQLWDSQQNRLISFREARART